MLKFFIGFAFFEAGAFFGFFVAALLNAAHAGQEMPTMAVLKPMLKLALLPLLLAQWVGIFLTTFSTVLTNLLAGLFFFVALASWIMKLADGGEVLKMLITAFVVFVLPYITIAAIAKISFFAEELRDFLQS